MAPETRSQKACGAVAVTDGPPSTSMTEQHARLRQETSYQFAQDYPDRSEATHGSDTPDTPPLFIIDLSLPPEQRYLEVCEAFKSEISDLTGLFDEVVGGMIHYIPLRWLRILCRIFLRRVYSSEENAELKGISETTGVEMYLLVCFNVLLDLFMGCSSGGAPVRAGKEMKNGIKMVHFRTLDWGMLALRRVVVQLDYISERNGPVIASSITYAGYVGVLTGVRKNLSMSLNFRPNRIDNGQFWADMKYAWHNLMVLLGQRPSISSILRHFLLPKSEKRRLLGLRFGKEKRTMPPAYGELVQKLGGPGGKSRCMTTTACYLCFSNGVETTVIEKDRVSAEVRSSEDLILVTNNDNESTTTTEAKEGTHSKKETFQNAEFQEVIEEARDRKECARTNWSNMRFAKLKHEDPEEVASEDLRALMDVDDVVQMVQRYPTTNECTHFACVMDPSEGKVSWCRRWLEPVTDDWIAEHASEIR